MARRAPQPKWTRRSAERPGEIVAAALDLFAERGYAATRLEDIAERAGISKATIYLYSRSKDELFSAIVRESVLPRVEAIESLIGGYEGSRAELLRTIIAAIGTIIATSRLGAVIKLIFAESGNFPEIGEFYYEQVVRRGLRNLSRIIGQGIAAGEFRPCDPDLAAKLIAFPAVMSVLWTTTFPKAPLDRQALLALHAEVAVRGLSVQDERCADG